jgi:hypothetical protein
MPTVKDEIREAIGKLSLSRAVFEELPDHEAERIFGCAVQHFLGNVDRRWWWEAFTRPSVSRQVEDGWKRLVEVTPCADQAVWFIAEETLLPFYPVYSATPKAIEAVIGQCYAFEYYLVAKDMSWLLCENHHDYLIGVGDPVITRLLQMPE